MGLSINLNKNGIKAHQLALDAISNNIANATTEGYKAKGVRFRTLLNNPVTEEDVLLNDIEPQISAGATSEVAVTDFRSGTLADARVELNLAATGNQFFGVQNGAGDVFLTKDGSFTVDGAGQLVNGNGHYLMMEGSLPQGLQSNQVQIKSDGAIHVQDGDQTVEVGRLNIFAATNPETLQPVGENYFVAPQGDINLVETVNVRAAMLEMSNVDLAQELTNMIVAQRAYSLNIKVSQATDEMMSNINTFSH